ncbi:MAG: sugar porter family MFS transporter [Saprospiraceae bacterium]|nr:sugar porter family MFS transporter [Saprospiraceae bacterium]
MNDNKSKLFFWSFVVSVAGFLFGFDTAVISGADQPIQDLWQTSALFHGTFIMSMALWGTVIGALFGGVIADKFGRKKSLIWIGVLYLVSALGSAMADGPYIFSVMRFIGGLGVGASSIAAPAYIAEISTPDRRGKLVALYQFNIVLGILIAFLSNYFLGGTGPNSWRWMLGVEAIPAFVYLVLIFRVPRSPRWLISHRNELEEARDILARLGHEDPDHEVQAIIEADKLSDNKPLFSGKYNIPLLLAFLLAFFNQVSGINFVIYYAPRIFEAAGLGAETALLSTTGIGLVNLLFTFVGLALIDKLGRKQLIIYGSIGYIVSLVVVTYSFYAGIGGALTVAFIFLFIASHAAGQGAVIWVFISEIFPNDVRGKGQSFGCGTHWVFAALITLVTLFFMDQFGNNPWPLFAFFAAMMVLQLLFALFMMPETKGVSLEDLEKQLLKKS